MRATLLGLGLWLAFAPAGAGIGVAPAMAQDTVVVATFNTEFLTRPKVHLKFGFPFNLSGIDSAQWAEPGFRDQQFSNAADSVAKVLAAIDAHVLALTPRYHHRANTGVALRRTCLATSRLLCCVPPSVGSELGPRNQ